MYSGEDMPVVYLDTPLKDAIFEITHKRLVRQSFLIKRNKLEGIITDGDLRRLMEKTLDMRDLYAKGCYESKS